MVFVACSGREQPSANTEPEETLGQVASAKITDVIPTSASCNLGHGPLRCLYVPLIKSPFLRPPETPPVHTFQLDGIRDEKEWTGSVQLAYTNQTSKANDGKIFLAVPQVLTPLATGGVLSQTHLRLFFEDFPIDTRAAPDEFGVVRVYLDYDRFTGIDEKIGPKDRLYEFNIIQGVPLRRFDGTAGGDWAQHGGSPGFQVATSVQNCKPDPSTNILLRCSAEVLITLNTSAITKPDPNSSVLPGFGFLVTDGQKQPLLNAVNSYPRGHNHLSNNPIGQAESRVTWQTILIGRPKGFPLKFMSWNIHRFKSSYLQEDFQYVTNADIGRFLALNDVVAIQEGWDSKAVEEILQHANVTRKQHGLPPFFKYGPPQVVTPEKRSLLIYLAGLIHTSPSQISHDGSSEMFDYDPVNDDHLSVLPDTKDGFGCVPWVKTIWDSPLYKNRAQIMFFMANGGMNPSAWETWAATVYPEDSASFGACTPYGIPYVCIETSFQELPPGEQF